MRTFVFALLFFVAAVAVSQPVEMTYIPAHVDFGHKISDWDGFGFNYVEAAQTRDYDQQAQDYGGFSLLSEEKKSEVLELIFGESGLQVQIVKMFLDPFHQATSESEFNHTKTASHMLEFVTSGNDLTKKRGDQLEIITTLYGAPAWATRQKFVGGRDLDEAMDEKLGMYMADWVGYLQDNGLPVKYLSLHNEGEDFYRWNYEDGTQRLIEFDYNLYWPPEQVNHFLTLMPRVLKQSGIQDVLVTNGEPSNWTRFHSWNYSYSLYNDQEALNHLGLLTTHGFIDGDMGSLSYSHADANTTSLLRQKKSDLHAWITSYSWGNMDVEFLRVAYEHIYTARVNALIPWAGIQTPAQWTNGDPNPGTAIQVNEDGTYQLLKGYYFYQQLTRAGHRGMSVVKTSLSNPVACIIGFGQNGTNHPDAFVLTSNIYVWGHPIRIDIKGTTSKRFKAYRTNQYNDENFTAVGVFEVENGSIMYDAPQGSTTTFIAID
jgi:O-glycosyl hydrolase